MARGKRELDVKGIAPKAGTVFLKKIYKKLQDGKAAKGPDGRGIVARVVWCGEAPIMVHGELKRVSVTHPSKGEDDAKGKQECCDKLDTKVTEAAQLETLWSHGIQVAAGESLDDALLRLRDRLDGREAPKPKGCMTLEEYFDQRFLPRAPERSKEWMKERFNSTVRRYAIAKRPIDSLGTVDFETWYTRELSRQKATRAYWKRGEKVVVELDRPISPRTCSHTFAILENVFNRAMGDLNPETREFYAKGNPISAARVQFDIEEKDKAADLPGGDIYALDKILAHVAAKEDTSENRRDMAFLGLLRMGRRAREVAAMRRSDVIFQDGGVYIRVTKQVKGDNLEAATKRNIHTTVKVVPELVPYVTATLHGVEKPRRAKVKGPRGGTRTETVWETVEPEFLVPALNPREVYQGRQHMTYSWIYHRFVSLAAEVGIKATPHMLRALFGTDLDSIPTLNDRERGQIIGQTVFRRRQYSVPRKKKLAAAVDTIKLGGRKDEEPELPSKLASLREQLGDEQFALVLAVLQG